MAAKLSEIGNVANMVASSIGIFITPANRSTQPLLENGQAFQDGRAVLSPTAEVVHLSYTRGFGECLEGGNDVCTMYLIAYLFTLISVNRIFLIAHGNFDQVAQKAMKLNT